MALPQARPPWLDTTMPRTPTATASGAAQGRTKMDGKGWKKERKEGRHGLFSSSIFTFFIFNLHLFHLHLFHPRFVFFLFFIFTWTKKIWKKHTTIPVLQPRDSEDLEKVLLWEISQLDYEGLFAASSTWLLEKWTAHTSTIFVSLTKKEASSTSKQIWKKLPPCSHVHPGGVSFSLRLQCILSTLNAFQVDRYICLIGIADSVRASFDVISPRMSFFGGGEGIEEKFFSPAMTSTKQFFNNKNSNCMFWFFFSQTTIMLHEMPKSQPTQPDFNHHHTKSVLYLSFPGTKKTMKNHTTTSTSQDFSPLGLGPETGNVFLNSFSSSQLKLWLGKTPVDCAVARCKAPWRGALASTVITSAPTPRRKARSSGPRLEPSERM